jgi:hypothetical protein
MSEAEAPAAADVSAGTGPPMLGSQSDLTFETWWERSGQHWAAARVDRGGTPWAEDEEKRRALASQLGEPADAPAMRLRRSLFARRYQRPGPPAGLPPVRSVRDLNAPSRHTTTTNTERY